MRQVPGVHASRFRFPGHLARRSVILPFRTNCRRFAVCEVA
jgi:hypothetical protein